MEENLESKVVKEKLDKAFKKLWTLERLDRKSLRTSHYNFGVEKPFVNDRGTFYIKQGSKTIKCQIIFDSNNYSFPPDILFHQLPKEVTEIIDDTKVLLPSEDWDLDNEECLYLWVQRILETIIKEPPVVENDKEKYMKGFFSDDDDVFEDGKKGDKQKKTSSVLDTKSKGEEEEPKIKKTWSIFKEIDDELDIFEEIKKDNLGEKTEKKSSPSNVKSDEMDIFEIFKKDDEEKSKTPTTKVKSKEQPEKSYADIEFEDDDFIKYNSSCDVVDTTVDSDEDMDEVVDTTKNRKYIPDVEIISSSRVTKEKSSAKDEKPMGRISANMAPLKRKLGKPETSSNVVDDSIFDFPTSPSTISSLYKNPKRQSTLTSPQRSGMAALKPSYTIERKPKDVVDLIIDDNDDFEETPPAKIRKQERQTKIFDLGTSKSPQNTEKRRSRLITADQRAKLNNTDSQTKSREEYRKKFMTAFLNRYRNSIIEYDAERYEQFSFYFTFGVTNTSEVWTQFVNRLKYSDDVQVNCKPKLNAPVVVQFKMDSSFPSSDLKIKIISVLNTTTVGSDKPESMDLRYEITEAETITNTVDYIMDLLKAKVPPFHYQLENNTFF